MRYGVTGNGILEEAEGMEAFWNQDWKGSVIICPGGGYQWLSPREGEPVAKAFAALGWKPWILYYSVAGPGEVLGTEPVKQAAEAVKMVRMWETEKPVFLCGFSAGGHVAASLGVLWNEPEIFSKDQAESIRPDGLILGYPVISAGEWAHRGSFEMLAGDDLEKQQFFSLENHVDQDTPPVFLWHTAEDPTVPVENSLLFVKQLSKYKIPFEYHVYPFGKHGLSLATDEVAEPDKERFADPHVAGWIKLCGEWMDEMAAGRKK